ncbi:MAG: class I SAM-dependent methyltransferase [Clostridia bacterium]|nr:class I SAM-dependent methyltransferase [Clostridia bacterium]
MKEYENALTLWNDWFNNATPQAIDEASMGNTTFDNAIANLVNGATRILDFGCGAGWASVIMAMLSDNQQIVAVDQAPNSINYAIITAKLSQQDGKINFVVADDTYLNNVRESSFDAIFSSNVLDVVPEDITQRMLNGFARVLGNGSKALIMLNPYIDSEYAGKGGFIEFQPNYFQKDGNLRIVNKTDEQWVDTFSRYFNVARIEHFNFEGENTSRPRRLFTLVK